MKKIDIKTLDKLQLELKNVKVDQALIICEGKEEKYAVISMEDYSRLQELISLDQQIHPFKYGVPEIKVLSDEDIEISYEEYENIKKQLLEALDKTFKPKLEKLN